MTTELSLLEKALDRVAVDQLPAILGELERLKMVVWQRVMPPQSKEVLSAPKPGLLSIPQVAMRLNIPESRAYELARRQGGLPVIRIGKYLRVDPTALEGWLSGQAQTGVDTRVSVAYTSEHGRIRTQKNQEATRLDSRATGRAAGHSLELDRAPGARRDRHPRIAGTARPVAGAE